MKAKMAPLLRTLLLAAACATLGPLEWRPGTAEAGSGMPCGDTIPDCNGVCPGTATCMPNMNNDACNCVQLGCCQAGANCISGDVSFICTGLQGQFVPNGTCGVECLPAGVPTSTPTPTVPPIPCGDTIPDCNGVCPGTTT